MRPTIWTPERDALLRELRASDMPRPEILARINEGFEPKVTLTQMTEHARTIGAKRPDRIVARYDHSASGPRYRTDAEYRAMSNAFAIALRNAGVRFQVVHLATPERQRVMTGKPPNHADLIAARVAMAAQGRLAVADVGVRGLV